MTNALVLFDESEYRVMQSMAKMMVDSGFFTDVKQVAQAMVKIQAGREIGLPPFAAMSGIHIVQGKPVLGANLIATLVKNDPRYDYRVKQADAQACVLTWYEGGRPVGESSFTWGEATAALLVGKDNWKKYPSDMLFARALTRGARRYAPGIFGGAPIYTPDELGVETDEEGHVIEGQVVTITPPPANGNGGNGGNGHDAPDEGPLPADEMTISEVKPTEFVNAVAGILETDAPTIRQRMGALRLAAPRNRQQQIEVYRALRANLGENVQAALFGAEPEPPTPGREYQD
jgi:hypothetical protein